MESAQRFVQMEHMDRIKLVYVNLVCNSVSNVQIVNIVNNVFLSIALLQMLVLI